MQCCSLIFALSQYTIRTHQNVSCSAGHSELISPETRSYTRKYKVENANNERLARITDPEIIYRAYDQVHDRDNYVSCSETDLE